MSRSQTVSKQASRGFTLIELMVVIAIISVLAAISIPVFSRTRENARQTRCTANLHAIAVALRSYMTDWNGFPLPYDAIAGTGGITQLYLEGYLTSNRVLRCPDDATTLADYIAANGINTASAPGSNWLPDANGKSELFNDRYSSYNQLLLSNAAYPLYNYYGYRGHSNFGSGISVTIPGGGSYTIASTVVANSLAGTGPSGRLFDVPANGTEIGILFGDGSGPPQDALGGQVWAGYIYTDASDAYHYNDGTGTRIFDRDMTKSYNLSYGRPLWDAATHNMTAYFPGLANRNAPDNTIVTHCPYHRSWFGSQISTQQDLIVRLGGDTEKQKLSGYDWVIQKQSTTE